MRFKTMIVAWMTLVSAIAAVGQEDKIDERSASILSDYLEALGGEMAIANADSFQTRCMVEGDGPEIEFEIKVTDGKFWMNGGDGQIVSVFDGTHEWQSMGGAARLLVDDVGGARFHQCFPFPPLVLNWESVSKRIRFVGETEFRGQNVLQVEFSFESFSPMQRYFDPNSGMLIGQDLKLEHSDKVVFEYEYAERDGLQWFSTIKVWEDGTDESKVVFGEYDFDSEIDQSIFEMPDDVRKQLEEGVQPERPRQGAKDKLSSKRPKSGKKQ